MIYPPKFEIGQIVYHIKGKAHAQVQSFEALDRLYCVKLVANPMLPESGFGMVYIEEKDLIPATSMGKAIFL